MPKRKWANDIMSNELTACVYRFGDVKLRAGDRAVSIIGYALALVLEFARSTML